MLKLNLKREPSWIDLAHGVRVKVKPASTALVMAARHAASRIEGDSAEASGVRTATLIAELAKADDKGKPAPVNAEGVAALMELWPLAEAFERKYLAPLYALDAEKNV